MGQPFKIEQKFSFEGGTLGKRNAEWRYELRRADTKEVLVDGVVKGAERTVREAVKNAEDRFWLRWRKQNPPR